MNNAVGRLEWRRRGLPAAIMALVTAAVFFVMPGDTAQGCADGIQLCLNVAVPSLFPMMFATIMATETGLTQRLGRLLSPVTGRLFRLSGEAGGAVVMALIGGFPAGVKTVSGLYARGAVNREEAARMCLFCFAAGPAFLLGAVGGMYGSTATGAVLLIIQIISVIIVGILSRILCRSGSECASEIKAASAQRDVSISDAMTRSVTQTANAMLNICLYIILFSILRAVLDASGISTGAASLLEMIGFNTAAANAVLPMLLEVTSGCASAVDVGLPAVAFAVGFGGLAVHMQVMAIAKDIGMKYGLFFAARVIQGMLCALMMQIYLITAPDTAISASAPAAPYASLSTTPSGAVLLVVMSAMCLLCLPQMEQ